MAKVGQGNKDYWQKRMAALEDDQYQRSATYYKDVQKQFQDTSNQIQIDIERWYQRLADNNGVSYAEAKKLLKKNELEEFHWSVEQYIKAGEENAVDQRWMKELENASARHHISYLEAMKLQTRQHAEQLHAGLESGMTDFLQKSYREQYCHSAFEIARGTGVGSSLAQIDKRTIDTLIKKPWAQDGKNFSDRIWTNKDKLVNNLHTELTQSIIRGADPKKAINNLAKTMEVGRAQAGCLIMTESAAVSSAAQKECFQDLDVERYEILATLDGHTSKICREMDGKVFEMKDYKVGETAPPFHPRCRTTTIPYFDDEFTEDEERAARDEDIGKTYYVPADMEYEEWEEQYVGDMLEDSFSDRIKKETKGILTGQEILNYSELPEDIRDSFELGLEHADSRVKELLHHEMNGTQYFVTESKNSEYTERVNVVGINPKRGSGSVAHEMFHRIDDKYKVTKDSNMLNNFVADFKGNQELYSNTEQYLKDHFPDAFEVSHVGRQRLKKEYQGVSDIFSALSDGKIDLGFIHKESYWTKKPERKLKEIWAQYGRLYYENNPEVLKMLNELFPSGSERVNMKLKGLMKNVER